MLYELAAGRRPFPGPSSTALAQQILAEIPTPLGTTAKAMPQELGRIVAQRLLEKRPEPRYQTAQEVQTDLSNLVNNLDLNLTSGAVPSKRTLAVLPFKLLTPSAADDYLSVALADGVIKLSAKPSLSVRPTQAVMKYVQQTVEPLAIMRELNVQVLIEGAIQKIGERLRVHVRAWNAADGSTLLSTKYDSALPGVIRAAGQDRRRTNRGSRCRAARPRGERRTADIQHDRLRTVPAGHGAHLTAQPVGHAHRH